MRSQTPDSIFPIRTVAPVDLPPAFLGAEAYKAFGKSLDGFYRETFGKGRPIE
jgi:hypothetical protein